MVYECILARKIVLSDGNCVGNIDKTLDEAILSQIAKRSNIDYYRRKTTAFIPRMTLYYYSMLRHVI